MAKNKIGIKPLGKSILLQVKKAKEKSESGIILPSSVNDSADQKEAVVVALGSGKLESGKIYKFEVSIGDTVMIPSHSGSTIEKNGESYIIIDESRITAILE